MNQETKTGVPIDPSDNLDKTVKAAMANVKTLSGAAIQDVTFRSVLIFVQKPGEAIPLLVSYFFVLDRYQI